MSEEYVKPFCAKAVEMDVADVNLMSYITLAGCAMALKKAEEEGGRQKGGEKRGRKKEEESYHNKKRRILEKFCNAQVKTHIGPVVKHLDSVKDALLNNGYGVKECEIESMGRGVVGVGSSFGKILFEVGLSFDPVFNVPYIPGSTLKGAFRSALEELAGEEEAERVFGSSKVGMGLVGVTDAYPVEARDRLFEPDVLTPHYPGVETELDVRPKPIQFLTIAPGVKFRCYIYYNKGLLARPGRSIKTSDEPGPNVDIHVGDMGSVKVAAKDLPLVDKAVLYAFARGVGAKTSVGYSRFKLVKYAIVSSR
ncbi:MAG: type III-B CRISPR module RAMP protein Cmr6 [Pyrobaculum sp.]